MKKNNYHHLNIIFSISLALIMFISLIGCQVELIESITIIQEPKPIYYLNEPIEVILKVRYNNGNTINVNLNDATSTYGITVTGNDTSLVGDYNLEISGSNIYALFSYKVIDQLYRITLDPNGGTVGTSFVEVGFNQPMPYEVAPTKDSDLFLGYFDSPSGGQIYYYPDMTSARNWDQNNDATLYAHWQAVSTLEYNQISGGYEVSIGSVAINDQIIIIPSTYQGESVIKIADQGFNNALNLEWIFLPQTITEIGDTPFHNCPNLTKVVVDNQSSHFMDSLGVLYSKDQTTLYYYPVGKTDGRYDINLSTTKIVKQAFYGASYLIEITIPDSVISIGEQAFENTGFWLNYENNKVVYLSNWVIGYKGNKDNHSGTVTILAGTIGIATKAFFTHRYLTKVELPTSLKYLNSSAFESCLNIKNFDFDHANSQLTIIEKQVFRNCTNLEKFYIPMTVTYVGNKAFEVNSSYSGFKIYVYGSPDRTTTWDAAWNVVIPTVIVYNYAN